MKYVKKDKFSLYILFIKIIARSLPKELWRLADIRFHAEILQIVCLKVYIIKCSQNFYGKNQKTPPIYGFAINCGFPRIIRWAPVEVTSDLNFVIQWPQKMLRADLQLELSQSVKTSKSRYVHSP